METKKIAEFRQSWTSPLERREKILAGNSFCCFRFHLPSPSKRLSLKRRLRSELFYLPLFLGRTSSRCFCKPG